MDDIQRQLRVRGVTVDRSSGEPVVFLCGAESGHENLDFVMVVGAAEASAIAVGMQGHIPERPLTHDLLCRVLSDWGEGVDSVRIRLLDEATYAATIMLSNGRQLDARASDAIAIAVRLKIPITMADRTLRYVAARGASPSDAREAPDSARSLRAHPAGRARGPQSQPISEEEIRKFSDFLHDVEPEDFDNR